MKKIAALTLAMTMALGLFLSGCAMEDNGGDTAGSGSTGSAGNNSSGTNTGKRVVNVCSWGEYIDTSLIDEFEEKTGIEVNYQTAESNEALYSTLALGGANYDVIVPSDYMISQLIEEGMLQELDYSKIPNFEKIDPRFRNLSYDPENLYTVPYTWGTLGIIYNTTMVDEPITSWSSMFDEKYADNVVMIRNSRDALGIALYYLGYSVNTTDESEIREAYQLLADANAKGVYQAFYMDEIFQAMERGNAAITAYYAGDYLTMRENNPDLAYVVPEEGSNWFVDAMCILKNAPPPRPTWPTWTISGMPLPTARRWSSTPLGTRSSTASLWIWSCMRLWPLPRRCWTGAKPIWSPRPISAICTTSSGLNWVLTETGPLSLKRDSGLFMWPVKTLRGDGGLN